MQQKLIIYSLNKGLEDPKMFCIGPPAQIVLPAFQQELM